MPNFHNLLLSRPLALNRTSDAPEVGRFVRSLFEMSKSAELVKNCSKPLIRCLTVVTLDLFLAWHHDPDAYVNYSRDNNHYKSGSRYNSGSVSSRTLIKSIDCLNDLGFIEHHLGWQDVSKQGSDKSYQSRMKPTDKLLSMMDSFGIQVDMISVLPPKEVIHVKDENKELVEYRDNSDTDSMRLFLEAYNVFLRSFSISLHVDENEWNEMHEILSGRRSNKLRPSTDLTRNQLHRVFNNTLDRNNPYLLEGGRFYGVWWQEIPSEYREKIVIDGKITCELDYASLHPRICYGMEGLDLPEDDLYAVPDCALDRKTIKVAVNVLLNATNGRESARRASQLSDQDLKLIERHFSPISGYFYTGMGAYLQYVDSIIAERTMRRSMDLGEPVLPVHDSFVCRTSFNHDLRCIMEEEVSRLLSTIPVEYKKHESIEYIGLGDIQDCIATLEFSDKLEQLASLTKVK